MENVLQYREKPNPPPLIIILGLVMAGSRVIAHVEPGPIGYAMQAPWGTAVTAVSFLLWPEAEHDPPTFSDRLRMAAKSVGTGLLLAIVTWSVDWAKDKPLFPW